MYDISISVLKAWSQKQDSSLVYLGRDGKRWTGRGGEERGVLWNYYNIYLHIYNFIRWALPFCGSLSCFYYGFGIHQYFFMFFLCLSSVSFWRRAMLYLHLVSAVRPSKSSSYCIHFIPIFLLYDKLLECYFGLGDIFFRLGIEKLRGGGALTTALPSSDTS